MKDLLKNKAKGSKLIVIYILTVLISGSILTFLSINSIYNFQELTEIRVLEEEKSIIENYKNQFQNSLEKVVISIEKITQNDTLINSIEGFNFENELVGDYLIVNRNGALIRPRFLENSFKANTEITSLKYNQNYLHAEHFEFAKKAYKDAELQYVKTLTLAKTKSDSAKIFNALARLSIKTGNQQKALEFYSRIIKDLKFTLNDFGFPYAYFSLNQLLKLTDPNLKEEIEEVTLAFLNGLLNNTIPYNSATADLIADILNTVDNIDNKNTQELIKNMCHDINIKISGISNYKEDMAAIMVHKKSDHLLRLKNFTVVENENDPNEIMLLQLSDENIVGYTISLKKLDTMVLRNINHNPGKFEYQIQLVDAGLKHSFYDKELIVQSNFSTFFNEKRIEVKLKNPSIIEDFVFKRKLTTVIGLILLLAAMLIGLFTLIRDVSNKKRMERMRADFVSNVTHELKTPLTSINMFADSIVLGRVASEEQLKKYAHIIVKESERLKRMVNNILDFSRTESNKLNYHLQEFNLSEIVDDIMHEMNYWLEINNFEVNLDLNENIVATVDPEGLKQVLSNLISNAIKYSDIKKKIEIRLYENKGKAFIEVEDHGIGIPEDKLKSVFEKFYRVNSKKNENISGTGLGLTVSKDIVEAQNGNLLVSSTVNKGSKFTIVLNL